jgi:hypothetical protein
MVLFAPGMCPATNSGRFRASIPMALPSANTRRISSVLISGVF